MKERRHWVKSTNGPDWTDIEIAMRFLGALHTGLVELVCSPSGIGANGGLQVKMTIHLNVLPGSSVPPVTSVETIWPNQEAGSFERTILGMVYRLDSEIARGMAQSDLWE